MQNIHQGSLECQKWFKFHKKGQRNTNKWHDKKIRKNSVNTNGVVYRVITADHCTFPRPKCHLCRYKR